MIVKVDTADGHGGGTQEREKGEENALREGDGRVGRRGVRGVAEEQEEGKGKGEEGSELGVGGGHAVALAVHL